MFQDYDQFASSKLLWNLKNHVISNDLGYWFIFLSDALPNFFAIRLDVLCSQRYSNDYWLQDVVVHNSKHVKLRWDYLFKIKGHNIMVVIIIMCSNVNKKYNISIEPLRQTIPKYTLIPSLKMFLKGNESNALHNISVL